jgi:cyclohexyl-isocyanide hydratase
MQTDSFAVVFAVFPGVTQLDFTGPHQVFSRWARARITVASADGGSIAADGLTFASVARLADVPRCDLLCVPGGVGVVDAIGDERFLSELRRLARGARYVSSVCTGSLALGAAGLLAGRRAACHWAWRDLLLPFGAIVDEGRVVRDGNVITGGGVTAGIDFALTVVGLVSGREIAEGIQLNLEYAPAPPFSAGRPESAPAAVLERVLAQTHPILAPRRAAVEEAARRLLVADPAA